MAIGTNLKKVYGIDLGSSLSAIAVLDDCNHAIVIANNEGERLTASAVFFESDGEKGELNAVVGTVAKESAIIDPDCFVDFIKPHMGSSEWRREIDGVEWMPEMLSALILRKLACGVECFGEKAEDVVIACPAQFNDSQRRAIMAAGAIAGLNVIGLIDESVAAALAYCEMKPGKSKTLVIYDLGGAFFDIAVIRINGTEIEVVSSDGVPHLGGRDWDYALAMYMADKYAEDMNVHKDDLLDDPETIMDLLHGAELTKLVLTHRPKVSQRVCHGEGKTRVEVTRDKFEELTRPLLEETAALTDYVLEKAAEKGVDTIDEFLLVGGSARMPQVREMIKARFGSRIGGEPYLLDATEAVVKGAAIYGAIMNVKRLVQDAVDAGKSETEALEEVAVALGLEESAVRHRLHTTVRNMASRSYGIRVMRAGEQLVFNLLHKQDRLPASIAKTFPIAEDNMATIPLQVFENDETGDRAPLDESIAAGAVEISLPSGLKAGSGIQITFKLDEDGVLAFEALDVGGNRDLPVAFTPKGFLTPEQLDVWKEQISNLELL